MAEVELQQMQTELADMLSQKNRLASLGLAVSKVSHDLRKGGDPHVLEKPLQLRADAADELQVVVPARVVAADECALAAVPRLGKGEVLGILPGDPFEGRGQQSAIVGGW